MPSAALVGIAFLSYVSAVCGLDCTGRPDMVFEYSCFFYTMCQGGVAVEIRCDSSQVFDPKQGTCVTLDPGSDHWPCSDVISCSTLADKRYPDHGNTCRTYYTCHNGYFYGHNWCPAGLVFHEEIQICDWPYNVYPPCGTKGTAALG